MTISSPLPLDLLFDIAEELASKDDLRSLRALSLTRKDAVPICRKALFKTISIPSTNRRTRSAVISNLHELLKRSPYVSQYVRSFAFEIGKDDEGDESFLLGLAVILSQLDYLTELRLTCSDFPTPLDWNDFSESQSDAAKDFCKAINDILLSPLLVNLRIVRLVNFPVESVFHRATVLDIWEYSSSSFKIILIDPPAHGAPQSKSNIPRLRNYTTSLKRSDIVDVGRQSYLAFSNIAPCLVDLRNLRGLCLLDVDRWRIFRMQGIFRCAQSLEEFTIQAESIESLRLLAPTISSGYFSKTSTLKFFIILRKNPTLMLRALPDLLGSFSVSNAIQNLGIFIQDLGIPLTSYIGDQRGSRNDLALRRLSTVFDPAAFPELKKFEFSLEIWLTWSTQDILAGEQAVQERHSSLFQELRTRDGLDFRSCTRVHKAGNGPLVDIAEESHIFCFENCVVCR